MGYGLQNNIDPMHIVNLLGQLLTQSSRNQANSTRQQSPYGELTSYLSELDNSPYGQSRISTNDSTYGQQPVLNYQRKSKVFHGKRDYQPSVDVGQDAGQDLGAYLGGLENSPYAQSPISTNDSTYGQNPHQQPVHPIMHQFSQIQSQLQDLLTPHQQNPSLNWQQNLQNQFSPITHKKWMTKPQDSIDDQTYGQQPVANYQRRTKMIQRGAHPNPSYNPSYNPNLRDLGGNSYADALSQLINNSY